MLKESASIFDQRNPAIKKVPCAVWTRPSTPASSPLTGQLSSDPLGFPQRKQILPPESRGGLFLGIIACGFQGRNEIRDLDLLVHEHGHRYLRILCGTNIST